MNILVGTTNRNKVRSVQRYLQAYDVQLVTPQDLQLHVRIEGDGATPIENARIKALAYYRSARIPTVAFDSGLYFLDLKEDDPLQPKTHVRRVQGRELNDEEMISYYRRIAADYGGRLLSAYRNGVCVVYDEQHIYTYMEDMETARDFAFYLCDTPHEQRTPGWPLDSISIDEKTMKYFHDMADTEYAAAGEDEKRLTSYRNMLAFYRRAFHLEETS